MTIKEDVLNLVKNHGPISRQKIKIWILQNCKIDIASLPKRLNRILVKYVEEGVFEQDKQHFNVKKGFCEYEQTAYLSRGSRI
mgnify:CR=1 FL=1